VSYLEGLNEIFPDCHVAWPDKHSISLYRLSIQSNNRQLSLIRRWRYVLGLMYGEEKTDNLMQDRALVVLLTHACHY